MRSESLATRPSSSILDEVRWPGTHLRPTQALAAARQACFSLQCADGHWQGELEGDSILSSDYILAKAFLGSLDDPRVAGLAARLREQQLESGGWTHYPGGSVDVSASVKAYFVLKLVGDGPSAGHMRRARSAILDAGGIAACNSFTKIYLAIFGQLPWRSCPAVPPEMVLLPRWAPFGVHSLSAWSRTIVVPLSVVWAHRPVLSIPADRGIAELQVDRPPQTGRLSGWERFFQLTDRLFWALDGIGAVPLRRRALGAAERWICQRLVNSDGLGAIFPPIVNSIFALRCQGYAANDPVVAEQVRHLDGLVIEDAGGTRVQPCNSPVWDTALMMNALLESGSEGTDRELVTAAEWLLEREVKSPGDWLVHAPAAPVGGWYFEYANETYPDTDDTAQVLSVLARVRLKGLAEAGRRAAIERGKAWLLGMQNADGGWGAFDRGCDLEVLTKVPFADHNAMIDPSCEDITGRCLEALSQLGMVAGHPAVDRAQEYLWRRQESDGTWYGRWGCNYIYGTWLAVVGLVASGVDPQEPRLQRSAGWLRQIQNDDGGWGESLATYDDPSLRGRGESSAAQTAWALLTLLATGDWGSESLRTGVSYLLATQRPDGTWKDVPWTGTGFPRVFYLQYHLYATYFPLLALGARAAVLCEQREEAC